MPNANHRWRGRTHGLSCAPATATRRSRTTATGGGCGPVAAVVGADLKQPNVITQRVASRNCHGQFMLAAPVHRNQGARMAPLRLLARVAKYH